MPDQVITNLMEDLRKGTKGMPLKSAVFEVGELSGITAKELEEYLQENADFEFLIDETKAKVRCRCGYEGMAEIIDSKDGEVVFMCSKCGDIPEIISGDKVKVSEVQVKD